MIYLDYLHPRSFRPCRPCRIVPNDRAEVGRREPDFDVLDSNAMEGLVEAFLGLQFSLQKCLGFAHVDAAHLAVHHLYHSVLCLLPQVHCAGLHCCSSGMAVVEAGHDCGQSEAGDENKETDVEMVRSKEWLPNAQSDRLLHFIGDRTLLIFPRVIRAPNFGICCRPLRSDGVST